MSGSHLVKICLRLVFYGHSRYICKSQQCVWSTVELVGETLSELMRTGCSNIKSTFYNGQQTTWNFQTSSYHPVIISSLLRWNQRGREMHFRKLLFEIWVTKKRHQIQAFCGFYAVFPNPSQPHGLICKYDLFCFIIFHVSNWNNQPQVLFSNFNIKYLHQDL